MHPESLPEHAKRKTPLSPLMAAKSKALQGQKVNACPFGCADNQLDEHGYCRHLVGFTTDNRQLEPMIVDETGRRVVRCQMVVNPDNPNGELIPQLEPVRKTDKLVRISVSSRVYREHPEPKAAPTAPQGA